MRQIAPFDAWRSEKRIFIDWWKNCGHTAEPPQKNCPDQKNTVTALIFIMNEGLNGRLPDQMKVCEEP